MSYAKRKAAFFDIDGTLVKGFIICAFPEYLSRNGFFHIESKKRIQDMLQHYKKGEIDASFAALKNPREYALGLKGQSKEKISSLAACFMNEYKKNVFSYAKQLVELMNKNGFLTIATSGSPIEVIEKLDFLGFNKFYGSEMSDISGRYDGKTKTNLIIPENKRDLFQNIIRTHNIDLESSFAFGDTEQDLHILTKVHYPVVLKPNKALKRIAEQKGWMISDEKEVIQKIMKILLTV